MRNAAIASRLVGDRNALGPRPSIRLARPRAWFCQFVELGFIETFLLVGWALAYLSAQLQSRSGKGGPHLPEEQQQAREDQIHPVGLGNRGDAHTLQGLG